MLQKLNEKQNIHICIAFTAMMPHIDNFCLKSSVIMTVCVNITLKKQTVKLQSCESCI